MIYELCDYVAAPGAADRLHRRFADHTLGLFARHHLEVVGFWTDADDSGHIVYLLTFADRAARDSAWAAFSADSDWQRVKAESEVDGPLLASRSSRILTATDY